MSKIGNNLIIKEHIEQLSVNTNSMAPDSVSTDKMQNNSITPIKLSPGAPTWDVNGVVTASAFAGNGSQLTNLPSLSNNQSWTIVTSNRNSGISYTNTSGNPILVAISAIFSNSYITVNGVQIINENSTSRTSVTFIVPNNGVYSITNISTYIWAEYR